jgi:hypothetical protein
MVSFTTIWFSFPKFQGSISFYSALMRLDKLNQINDVIDDKYILSEVANVSLPPPPPLSLSLSFLLPPLWSIGHP